MHYRTPRLAATVVSPLILALAAGNAAHAKSVGEEAAAQSVHGAADGLRASSAYVPPPAYVHPPRISCSHPVSSCFAYLMSPLGNNLYCGRYGTFWESSYETSSKKQCS